jgi:hypothetical protein
MLPFQGDVFWEGCITQGVALGWEILPFQGDDVVLKANYVVQMLQDSELSGR